MESVIDILLTIFFAVLGFGILVFIHELGHMIVGRLVGIGVEKFSIGFGPAILKFKIKGILFKLGCVPFGGYCKFKGQDDFGKGQRASEPDDFYSRPAWARFLTVFAGPFFNILLAVIIFISLFLVHPTVLDNKTIIINESLENASGLKNGDEILAIDSKTIKYAYEIRQIKINKFNEELLFTVLRDGEAINISYTPSYAKLKEGIYEIAVGDSSNPVIIQVVKDSPADKSGLKPNDKILKINGQTVTFAETISKMINASKEEYVTLTIQRGSEIFDVQIKPELKEKTKIIGVAPTNLVNPSYKAMNFGEIVIRGINECYVTIRTTIKGLGLLFSGQENPIESVAGPIGVFGMVGTIGATKPLSEYIYMIALISVLLGFFNLLPIPAVDGGHIILNIVEMIRRKPISMKVVQTIQIVGVVIILILFVLVAIKDIVNLPDLLNNFR